jgi:ferritin-like metal-binding protein YciE
MARLKSLQDLYVNELKDLYSAENQILKALPKMAQAASSPQLQQAFQEHLQQTHTQVDRLDRIFSRLGQRATGKKCEGVAGLIEEGKELMQMDVDEQVMDAGLIVAAQKVEHYEMAGYGSVRTFARLLGEHEAAQLLQQTLDEEGATDKKLTALAEGMVNQEAADQGMNGGSRSSEARSSRSRSQ